MKKTIRVAGQATVYWTAYVPEGAEPNICDDPAVEAVLGAIGQVQDVYIFGPDAEPVHVDLEINEDDVEVEEDDRKC